MLEDTPQRLVIATRRYGLLAGGVFFIAAGAGLFSLALNVAARNLPAIIVLASLSLLMALFGCAACWASVKQRDTITIDRQGDVVRSQRASRSRRPGGPLFRVEEAALTDLMNIELRARGLSAWLRFNFRSSNPIDIDHGTDVQQLEALGEKLAAAAGSELVRR